jgi:PAS domain S-box-containing protein
MNRRTMLARALIATGLLVSFAVLGLTLLLVADERRVLQRQLEVRGGEVAQFLANQCEFPMLVGDRAELGRIAEAALAGEDVVHVALADLAGNVVAEARRPGPRTGRFNVVRPIHSPQPIGWETGPARKPLGSVRLGFSTEKQRAQFARTVRYAGVVAGVSLLVILTLQCWHLKRLLTPLHELSRFAREVAAGGMARRAPVVRDDEVGELALAFNQMLDQLGATTVSRNYVDSIIRSMGDSLMVTGTDGLIRTVNSGTLAMLGYTEEQVLGKSAHLVVGAAAELPCKCAENVYRARDGREIPVLLSASPLYGQDGVQQGTVWLAQDVTERKRVQQELLAAKEAAEQASAAKSLFLATMSHELRTPLNAIAGYTQLIRAEMRDRGVEDWMAELDKVERSCRHLTALINDVLDLSKIEAGRMDLEQAEFDLAALVREVVESLEPIAATNGNRITVVCPEATARGDARRVHQSLLNLVANACKFTRNGLVEVALQREARPGGPWYLLKVKDTGIGIAAEQLPKLFESFSQADPSTTRRFGGSGLGLAISRKLCRLMGGDIWVKSELGRGSEFVMGFPARAA